MVRREWSAGHRGARARRLLRGGRPRVITAASGRCTNMAETGPILRGHRPALDGVRAVAVLAVLAYHTSIGLPGGFLGVDVFLVLSGYLITGLLLSEQSATGRIALGSFWARRARRLLPAVL